MLLSCLCFPFQAPGIPKALYSQFDGLNIQDLKNDIDLTDGVLWIRVNYDAPIPEVMGNSVIFVDVCMNVYEKQKEWEKYPFKQVKVTTLVEWKAYLFNGGQKECIDILTVSGAAEKYKQEPYFQEWQRK